MNDNSATTLKHALEIANITPFEFLIEQLATAVEEYKLLRDDESKKSIEFYSWVINLKQTVTSAGLDKTLEVVNLASKGYDLLNVSKDRTN